MSDEARLSDGGAGRSSCVFITGGTGLIGYRVVRALRQRHTRVIVLTRNADAAAQRTGPGVELVEGDPTVSGAWQEVLAQADAVVNLAGEPIFAGRWTKARKQRIWASRVQAATNVAQAAAGGTPEVLVSASAIGYYGPRGDEQLTETTSPGTGFMAELVVAWEAAAETAGQPGGCRVVTPRISKGAQFDVARIWKKLSEADRWKLMALPGCVPRKLALSQAAPSLDADSYYVRRQAVRWLGRNKASEAKPRLLKKLHTEKSSVRYEIVGALAEIGGKDVVDTMIELLAPDSWAAKGHYMQACPGFPPYYWGDGRRIIVAALARMKAKRSAPAVLKVLQEKGKGKGYLGEFIIPVLGDFGYAEAIPELKAILAADEVAGVDLHKAYSPERIAAERRRVKAKVNRLAARALLQLGGRSGRGRPSSDNSRPRPTTAAAPAEPKEVERLPQQPNSKDATDHRQRQQRQQKLKDIEKLAGKSELIVLGTVTKVYDGRARDGGMSYDVKAGKVLKGKLAGETLHFRSAGHVAYAEYKKGETVLLFLYYWGDRRKELLQHKPVIYLTERARPATADGARFWEVEHCLKVLTGAAERAKRLRADLKKFRLELHCYGPEQGPSRREHFGLALAADGTAASGVDPNGKAATGKGISSEIAEKIIDHLDTEGFLSSAASVDFKLPKIMACVLVVSGPNGLRLREVIAGWGPRQLRRLRRLRELLDGDAARAMDRLIQRWQTRGEEWGRIVVKNRIAQWATTGIEWVDLKAGKIELGPPGSRRIAELKRPIRISRGPITCIQYSRFLTATKRNGPVIPKDDLTFQKLAGPFRWEGARPSKEHEDWPVTLVSFDDAKAYCQWLTTTTGRPYRLPTKDELNFALGDAWYKNRQKKWIGNVAWWGLGPVGGKNQVKSKVGLQCFPHALSEWTSDNWVGDGGGGHTPRKGETYRCAMKAPGRLLRVYGIRVVTEPVPATSQPAAGSASHAAKGDAAPPAAKPLDLDKTAKMLTKAAGGKWRTKTKALYGTIPIPMNAVFDTLCVVFPFPYDEAGKAKVLSFTKPRARGFRVLGSTEQCTVLVDRNLPDPPEKAAAFFAAVSKALKLRPPKLTLAALRRSRQLKANINSFALNVWYHGPKDKSYYRLLLTAVPIERKERPFEMIRVLNPKQAERIIDHLAAEGFLTHAVKMGRKTKEAYEGPAYLMTIPTGISRLEGTLGWGPGMLKRLDALRDVLDGYAASAMDSLLMLLTKQHPKWKKPHVPLPVGPRLLGKILSVRQVVRGEYTFIAICEALDEPQGVSAADGAYQKFKVHAVLDGTGPAGKTFDLNYNYYAYSSPPERPVRKGEKVIWIVSRRTGSHKGVKVLAYTPENHNAVGEAVLFERFAGKAVNGLKLTLRAAKATTAMRPDGRSAEPVPLAFTFANVGDKPIKIETSDHLWPRLKLHVTGPDGKSVRITELMLERIGPIKVTYSVLKAGRSLTYSRQFPGAYFNYKGHDLLKPGAYRIWASYLSAVAVSNEITLTVTAAPATQPAATAEAALRAKVRALLADLESDDRRVRWRASVALGKLGPESAAAVPDLAAALGGKDRHARISALLMLTRIGPAARDAVGALIKVLKDEDRGVRYSAAEALGAIGPAAKAAVPLLILALKDADSDVQYHARKALGKIGPPAREAVPALIRAVKDKNLRVRDAAVTALGQLGPAAEAAVPALVEAMKDTDYQVGPSVGEALLKLGPAAVPHLIQAVKTGQRPLRWHAAEVLGKMGPAAKAAVPELIRMLKEEKGVLRAAAAKALGGIGPVTKGVIPALIQALRDGPSYEPGSGSSRPVRSGADEVLVKMQGHAIPALIRVVNDPTDEARARREAVRLLGWMGPAAKAAVPTLLKTLDSIDPWMRQQVVDSLGRIGPVTKEVVPALIKALADEEDRVRYHAAEALGAIQPVVKAAIPGLIKAAKDKYPTVRKYAVRSLGKIDPTAKGVLPVLLAALKDPASNVRCTAAEIVGQLAPAGKQAMPIFIDLLKDEDWKVRTAAAKALVSLGPAPKTAVLPLARATTDSSGSVAQAAAMALAKMGPAAGEAVPVLLRALGDKSPWVRSHAAKALGALGPLAKQAKAALTQALKDEDVHVHKAAVEALKRIRAGKPKAIGFQPIPAKSIAYVDGSWVTIYLVADDAVLRLMIPLGKTRIKGNSVVPIAPGKGQASLFQGKDAWRHVRPRGAAPPLTPSIKIESAVSVKFTCIDIPAQKTWPYHGKTKITVKDMQLAFPSGRVTTDGPLTFVLRPFPPGAAVPANPAAAAKATKEADRAYAGALRMRVLLGNVAPDGTVKQQFEDFYESPQLKKVKLRVWARTEGRILKVKDDACYVEVPATRVLGKVAAKEPAGGWLPLARRRTVFDVIGVLLANRKRSRVTVNLHCKNKRIVSGSPLEVSAAFTNTSKTIETVHFGPLFLRDGNSAAPLPDLGGPGSERIRAVTRNIEPGKTITITTKLLPKLPPADAGGSYRLYAIYSIREGPNGPMPVRMISDSVPVSIAAPAARPVPFDLGAAAKLLEAAVGGKWDKRVLAIGPEKVTVLAGRVSARPGDRRYDQWFRIYPFGLDGAGGKRMLQAPRAHSMPNDIVAIGEKCTVIARVGARETSRAVAKALKLKSVEIPHVSLYTADVIERGFDQFVLRIRYHGPKGKQLFDLTVTAGEGKDPARSPRHLRARIDKKQGFKLIHYLLLAGYLDRMKGKDLRYPPGPAYTVAVAHPGNEDYKYYRNLGWGPLTLERLRGLRGALGTGGAGTAMDRLLKCLDPQGKPWAAPEREQPLPLPGHGRGLPEGFGFVAVCQAASEPTLLNEKSPHKHVFQRFKVLKVLAGKQQPGQTVLLRYTYLELPSQREGPIAKGGRVIWIVVPGYECLRGTSVLADTPRNRAALAPLIATATLAAERVGKLGAALDKFRLSIWYCDEKGAAHHNLTLHVPAAAPAPVCPFHGSGGETKDQIRLVRITTHQAGSLIDHLWGEGFLAGSRNIHALRMEPVAFPAMVLKVHGPDKTTLFENLYWGLPMLKRLGDLRPALDGQGGAKEMAGLRKRLAEQHPDWQKLLGKTLSVRRVVRHGYTFIAICEALNEPQAVPAATGAYQKFKARAVLEGPGPAGKTFDLNYYYYANPSSPDRPVRKGEKVIWIVRKRADRYQGARVLAYTPENHKAVLEAVQVERYAGKAVNGLKLTLRAAKATTAMRPDGRSAEPVPLAFTFANVGDKPIKLETSDHLWPRLALHVTGPDGKSVRITELMLERIGPIKVTYSVLKTGQSVTYSMQFPGGCFNYKSHDLLKPGAYRIWASYLSAVAVSNEITLTVTAAPATPSGPGVQRPAKLLWGPQEKALRMAAWLVPRRHVLLCVIRNHGDRPVRYSDYLLGYLDSISLRARPKGTTRWHVLPRTRKVHWIKSAGGSDRNVHTLAPGKEMPLPYDAGDPPKNAAQPRYSFGLDLRDFQWPDPWRGDVEVVVSQTLGNDGAANTWTGTLRSAATAISMSDARPTRATNRAAPSGSPGRPEAFDLDAAAKLLADKVGGTWKKKTLRIGSEQVVVLDGRVSRRQDGTGGGLFRIYPFPFDRAGRKIIGKFGMDSNAPNFIAGSDGRCTLLGLFRSTETSQAVRESLKLRKVNIRGTLSIRNAELLESALDRFVLHLRYHGPKDKRLPSLTISTRPIKDAKDSPEQIYAVIDPKHGPELIHHLLLAGCFENVKDAKFRYPEGPAYTVTVPRGVHMGHNLECYKDFGWGPGVLKRLDALRKVLDGHAAKAMDKVLKKLAPQRKRWQQASNEPNRPVVTLVPTHVGYHSRLILHAYDRQHGIIAYVPVSRKLHEALEVPVSGKLKQGKANVSYYRGKRIDNLLAPGGSAIPPSGVGGTKYEKQEALSGSVTVTPLPGNTDKQKVEVTFKDLAFKGFAIKKIGPLKVQIGLTPPP